MKAVFVIAPDQFRDEEYDVPSSMMRAAGIECVVASVKPGTCTGRFGLTAEATIDLSQALDEDADAVVFVGGGGAQVYFDDEDAHSLACKTYENGRVLGAICIAPTILGKSGLLDARTVTSFPSEEEVLVSLGAKWTGEPCEVSHVEDTGADIVTANGPQSAEAFGTALIKSLQAHG